MSSIPAIEPFVPRLVGERTWGEEILIAETPHYTMKKLVMFPDRAGGLQYHVQKDETFYLDRGRVAVDTDCGDGKLTRFVMGPGMSLHIPAGAVHRVLALDYSVLFETSTPHHNDRVRVEARYGEPEVGGLPTTR